MNEKNLKVLAAEIRLETLKVTMWAGPWTRQT